MSKQTPPRELKRGEHYRVGERVYDPIFREIGLVTECSDTRVYVLREQIEGNSPNRLAWLRGFDISHPESSTIPGLATGPVQMFEGMGDFKDYSDLIKQITGGQAA